MRGSKKYRRGGVPDYSDGFAPRRVTPGAAQGGKYNPPPLSPTAASFSIDFGKDTRSNWGRSLHWAREIKMSAVIFENSHEYF
jgi:hypothetical protein